MLRLIPQTFTRHHSTNTTVKPLKRVPSLFNKINSASNVKPNYQPGLYHHPAPSASIISTPDVFLPQNDQRKGLNVKKEVLGPTVSQPREKKLNLTPEEVSQIQKLRLEQPELWTRSKLAAEFNVSPFTISLVSNPNKQRSEEMQQRLQTIKESWGRQRYLARLDRKKRAVNWYRDE
ncbi:hypothetical protein WICPIJ_006517 [Wickerhamomyces pijperi]|uniref:54S ribosomal protein L20, mitochondrial n=1 Tax=Wickerhamomyces pijperi TaxID=599730 RepID=A0A9P8Q1X7_WICPI|nr:hypothetical protein WICPIJ_006517 [Wickerhamomyces pijperi]